MSTLTASSQECLGIVTAMPVAPPVTIAVLPSSLPMSKSSRQFSTDHTVKTPIFRPLHHGRQVGHGNVLSAAAAGRTLPAWHKIPLGQHGHDSFTLKADGPTATLLTQTGLRQTATYAKRRLTLSARSGHEGPFATRLGPPALAQLPLKPLDLPLDGNHFSKDHRIAQFCARKPGCVVDTSFRAC